MFLRSRASIPTAARPRSPPADSPSPGQPPSVAQLEHCIQRRLGGAGGVLQSSGILGLSTGTAGGGKIQWTHNSGGFAAQGGPLTVTLDSGGTETWGVAPFNVSGGLIFGSPTADNPVTFTNSIILNAGNRNIYVNPGVGGNGADYAVISGNLIVASGDTTSQITKKGNGLLILAGSNSYPGATTITAGTLQIGNGGNSGTLGSGAVSNSGALVFDRSDSGLILPNAISGTGSLVLIGSGIVTLTGANTYAGPTTVAAGTLRLGTGAARRHVHHRGPRRHLKRLVRHQRQRQPDAPHQRHVARRPGPYRRPDWQF